MINRLIFLGKLILTNIAVFLFLLLLIEMVFRFNGLSPYPGKKPNIQVFPDGYYFQKDSLLGYKHRTGTFDIVLKDAYKFTTSHDSSTTLRLTAHSEKDTSKSRPEIWFLGCSFTHGWAINDRETFPWILQKNNPNLKIINWGVSGYGTIHFYLQLKEALKKGPIPKMVVLNHADFHFERNLFTNERRRNVSKWNFLGNLNQPYCTLNEDKKLVINYSNLEYDCLELSKYLALSNYLEIKYKSIIDKQNGKNKEIITRLILDKIVALCKEHEIEITLIDISGNSLFLENYANTRNIFFYDISVDLSRKEYTNMPYDGHPSFMANQLFAYQLDPIIKKCIIKNK